VCSSDLKGEIQPVGGINSKIEGFFAACKTRGLSGDQGVVIPIQNSKHLMLNEEVIEAVKQGRFHLYCISTVDEGLELLSGVEAGTEQEEGGFPPGTFNAAVLAQLQRFNETLRGDKDDGDLPGREREEKHGCCGSGE